MKTRIVYLDWLRVIACLMVMIVHASECIYSNDYTFSFPSEEAKMAVLSFQSFVRPTAVPLFLMASAFLLVPVKYDTLTFFKKRFTRVLIPLLVFLPIYAVLPSLWGAQTWEEAGKQLIHCYVNFPISGSHLWFVYMLLGLYLIMPVISPWLDKISRKEEGSGKQALQQVDTPYLERQLWHVLDAHAHLAALVRCVFVCYACLVVHTGNGGFHLPL